MSNRSTFNMLIICALLYILNPTHNQGGPWFKPRWDHLKIKELQ